MNELAVVPNAAPSAGSPGWTIQHRLPGRIRLYHPNLRGNPPLAQEVEGCLSQLRGVHSVRVSARSGTVLIVFDENTHPVGTILDEASAARPGGDNARGQKPSGQKSAHRKGDRSRKTPSMALRMARRLRNVATGIDQSVKQATGGVVDLKRIAVVFLGARAGVVAATAGPLTWPALTSLAEFIITWTLYENPKIDHELKQAKDVATPGP